MTIKWVTDLPASLADEAWALYHAAFRELNALAVQRHLMYRGEFDAVIADRRVRKYLAIDDDGTLAGLATYTNDLDAVPLISPAYFERRWPQFYTQRRIWYVGFVAVHPSVWHRGLFIDLLSTMYHDTADDGGIRVFDMCRHNVERGLQQAVAALLDQLGGMRAERADEQSYWAYEFPTTDTPASTRCPDGMTDEMTDGVTDGFVDEAGEAWGIDLVLDLGGCDPATITSAERLAEFATELCRLIDMRAYGPPTIERFGLADEKTAGYTLVQLIETSSVVAHFCDAWRASYVNVFSCRPFDTEIAAGFVAGFFGAQRTRQTVLVRR
jgi:S-adenosylmethionine/arginine decarboxylase-like enzyme